MNENDIAVSAFHNQMGMIKKNTIKQEFRTGATRVLITNDQMDLEIIEKKVKLVINYDLLLKKEDYIKRVGGHQSQSEKNITINFVGPNDSK